MKELNKDCWFCNQEIQRQRDGEGEYIYMISMYNEDDGEYSMHINYCPICGKKCTNEL